jgi:ankyrin repeat protein
MGSYFSRGSRHEHTPDSGHTHTPDCCPTNEQWCKKLDKYGDPSFIRGIYRNSESECLKALSEIANIHTRGTTSDHTLLHYAVSVPYTQLTQMLINRGINIHAVANGNNTALHSASCAEATQVKILIDNGADVNVKNNHKYTPLCYAILHDKRDVCSLLLEAGAYVHVKVDHDYSPLTCLSILVAYGFPIDTITPAELPRYLADMADAAFSRRKAAIRWWFGRNA